MTTVVNDITSIYDVTKINEMINIHKNNLEIL